MAAAPVSHGRAYAVKLCYCDESGTGNEPIATMVGIVVDATRMAKTKRDWAELLAEREEIVGKQLPEIKGKELYPGKGPWFGVNHHRRVAIISKMLDWLVERKHSVVYAALDKAAFDHSIETDQLPHELNTHWRFLGFHLVLAMQRFG